MPTLAGSFVGPEQTQKPQTRALIGLPKNNMPNLCHIEFMTMRALKCPHYSRCHHTAAIVVPMRGFRKTYKTRTWNNIVNLFFVARLPSIPAICQNIPHPLQNKAISIRVRRSGICIHDRIESTSKRVCAEKPFDRERDAAINNCILKFSP